MPRPALITVDDEPEVARAVERDLRRRYGGEYQVLRAGSGADALELLRALKRRDQPIALLLADQRMPRMTGVEFLRQAIELAPDARRVLLTAYADTEAAIMAINDVGLDHYLRKPWEPPEEELYPIIGDLLDAWKGDHPPPDTGVRVVGHRFLPESHAVRDFLGRNRVPYRFLEVERDDEATRLLAAVDGNGTPHLPVLLFEDGSVLQAPENRQIAERLGLKTEASKKLYDLVIVGGGPAGLAAAVYGASEGLDTVLLERQAPGGQAGTSSFIENYLGFPKGLSGAELTKRATDQALRFGAELLSVQDVERLDVAAQTRAVRVAAGEEVLGHTVLIASGVAYRTLDAPGVERLTGAGIYYGAARSEGPSCQGQDVYIVGGANSAGQAAVYFADHAREVHMLCRSGDLGTGMSQYLVDKIRRTPNIVVHQRASLAEAQGDDRLAAVAYDERGERHEAPAAGLFIFIGAAPHTDWVGDAVARDPKGFVVSGRDVASFPLERDPYLLETSVPGVFVAGDVRHRSIKRVASAAGEGAMAVQFVHQFLATR